MKYFKRIEGERIYLSPISIDDAETYVKWLNDVKINQYLSCNNSFFSLTGEREFLEKESSKEFMFAIVKQDNDELIGNVGLDGVDYKCGIATLGIFIGEQENLSKGYGSEAIKLLLDFAFNELRLHNIMLTVYDMNERAQKAYKKCGFKEFGRRHEARFHDGKYHDIIYMEVINDKI